jgi:hypothetical protein
MNALTSLSGGKSFAKGSSLMLIAGKIQISVDSADLDSSPLSEIEVELSKNEAKVFWKELSKAPAKAFGRNQMNQEVAPAVGHLSLMMQDLAGQLGEEVEVEEEEEESDDDDSVA